MMIKKMMLLAMAVGALVALPAPAVAGAQLLIDNGKALPVGAEVTATSTNLVKTTGLGTITCAKVTLHFKVTANGSGGSGVRTVSSKTDGCDLLLGGGSSVPAEFTDKVTDVFVALGNGGIGLATATFVVHIPPAGVSCHTEGSPNVSYTTNTDLIHVQGPLSGNCGEAEIHGDFTLETSDGTPVIID